MPGGGGRMPLGGIGPLIGPCGPIGPPGGGGPRIPGGGGPLIPGPGPRRIYRPYITKHLYADKIATFFGAHTSKTQLILRTFQKASNSLYLLMLYISVNVFFSHVATISCLPGLNQY